MADRQYPVLAVVVLFVSTLSFAQDRSVVITVDDLPLTQQPLDTATAIRVNRALVDVFKRENVPAIGFVVESKLYQQEGETDERIATLKMWTDAGLELGNHTFAHVSLFRTPLAQYQDGVVKGDTVTNALLKPSGKQSRYFRHPFLNTGKNLEEKQQFEQFLTERGYKVAPVTMDNMEWIFATEYAKAVAAGDAEKRDRIGREYVPYMESTFAFYEQLSREMFGREIPQILLVHANQLNAALMPELLAMMKRRGYRFISLDEALKDEAYKSGDTYTGPVGISWLQRWNISRGKQMTPEPRLPEYMQQFDSPASGSAFKTGTAANK